MRHMHEGPHAEPAGDFAARAAALDAADPLAGFRRRFVVDDPDLVYLDGNSLGRLPRATRERVTAVLDGDWGRGLVRSWDHWVDLPLRAGDRLATEVLGARPGDVAVLDSTTVNLYRVASAALADRPGRPAIVASADDFPTDRYVLDGLAREHGGEVRWLTPDPVEGVTAGEVAEALAPDVGLVVLSLVHYRSGAIADLEGIETLAREHDVHVLWDLSHAAGAIPLDLAARDVSLAVGCTYKYLNAGPGAPAFLYVRRDLQPTLRSPIQGWFGQRDQFAMGTSYDPADGIERFAAGSPPVLAMQTLDASLDAFEDAGMERVAAKGRALTSLAVDLADAWLAPLGFTLASPRDAERRGAHVSFRHPEAWRIARALIERAGVVADFRQPDLLRLGFAPLTTSFVDVHDALDRIRALVERGEHLAMAQEHRRVT
jgi:kynureninase